MPAPPRADRSRRARGPRRRPRHRRRRALFAAIDGGARLWSRVASGGDRLRSRSTRGVPRTATRVRPGACRAAARGAAARPRARPGRGLSDRAPCGSRGRHGAAGSPTAWGGSLGAAVGADGAADVAATARGRGAGVVVVGSAPRGLAGAAAAAARGATSAGPWWTLLATPLAGDAMADFFIGGLWDLLRGGATSRQPSPADLGRRYRGAAGRQSRSAGVPRAAARGARSRCPARRRLCPARPGRAGAASSCATPLAAGDRRSAEAFDLAGAARDVLLDAVAGALAFPAPLDAPMQSAFPPESYWRGETHRLSRSSRQPACGSSRKGARRRTSGDAHRDRRLERRRSSRPRARRVASARTAWRVPRVGGSGGGARRGRSACGLVRSCVRCAARPQPGRRAGCRGRVRRAVGSLASVERTGRSRVRGRLPAVHRTGRRRQRRRVVARTGRAQRGVRLLSRVRLRRFLSAPLVSCRNCSASSSSLLGECFGSRLPNFGRGTPSSERPPWPSRGGRRRCRCRRSSFRTNSPAFRE